jgi:hypothetical protein
MNQDQVINLVQKLFVAGGGYLAAKGIGDNTLWEAASGFLMALITWYISHKWNATAAVVVNAVPASKPSAGTGSQSGNIRFSVLFFLALLSVATLMWAAGCAAIAPGNDPLVVNVERTETVAKSTFDLVLNVDNANRAFFTTNTPPFHQFCEWLRQPQSVPDATSANGAMVTLPRCTAMLLSLDNVKLEYKSARAGSNEVFTALQTVTSAMAQANAWLTVVTNQIASN